MKRKFSCGDILYTKNKEGKREYVLIMEANGSYGVPKGHKKSGETDLDCALREIKEETGLTPTILPDMKRTIHYSMPNGNFKEVTYFVGKYDDQELIPEDSNILAAKKFTLDAALSLIKYPQVKDILVEIDYMLDIKGE
jgi:8-oxo-dGTP pyrophosphatase MutT (NUDIX family)